MATTTDTMEKIVALCRRRGFIFGSSEIYGGIGGFWDYGPLGTELKRNIKDAWWFDMVRNPPPGPGGRVGNAHHTGEYQMVGVDCSIIMNPKVWEASGHVSGFSDPMRDCKLCKGRFRDDQIEEAVWASEWHAEVNEIWTETTPPNLDRLKSWASKKGKKLAPGLGLVREPDAVLAQLSEGVLEQIDESDRKKINPWSNLLFNPNGQQFACDTCPTCGGELSEPREFNLMFQTYVGALQDAASRAYLRPETAQGIFVNFKNVMDSTRVKIPFGIAQIGKAFRNEINPRNYTFRSREFEQMEIEFFCKPEEFCRPGEPTSMDWYEFWRDARIRWYESLNIKSEKLRPREQGKDELAHYSSACTDIEYLFPFSDEPQELEGVAHRGDFDLRQHGKFARGDDMAFAVINDSEPPASAGADSRTSTTSPVSEPARGLKSAVRYVPHVIEPSAGVDRFALAVICEAYCHDPDRASPEFMKFHPRLAPIKAAVFPLVAKDGLPEIAEPIYREIKKHLPCQYDAKQSIGKRYARMDEAGTPYCFTIDGQTKQDGTVTVRNRDDASQVRIDKSRCLDYLKDKLRL